MTTYFMCTVRERHRLINRLSRVLREQVRAEVQLPPAARLQPQGLLLPFQGQSEITFINSAQLKGDD